MEKHIIIRQTVLNAQVCSEGTIEEVLAWLRATSPSGTTNNWQIDERPEVAPVQCKSFPERKHYVFGC